MTSYAFVMRTLAFAAYDCVLYGPVVEADADVGAAPRTMAVPHAPPPPVPLLDPPPEVDPEEVPDDVPDPLDDVAGSLPPLDAPEDDVPFGETPEELPEPLDEVPPDDAPGSPGKGAFGAAPLHAANDDAATSRAERSP